MGNVALEKRLAYCIAAAPLTRQKSAGTYIPKCCRLVTRIWGTDGIGNAFDTGRDSLGLIIKTD